MAKKETKQKVSLSQKVKQTIESLKEAMVTPTTFTEVFNPQAKDETTFILQPGSNPTRDIFVKAWQTVNAKYAKVSKADGQRTNDLARFGNGLELVSDFINDAYPLPKGEVMMSVQAHDIYLTGKNYALQINFNKNDISVSPVESSLIEMASSKDFNRFGEIVEAQYSLQVLDANNQTLPGFTGFRAMEVNYGLERTDNGTQAKFVCDETILDKDLSVVASYNPVKSNPTTSNSETLLAKGGVDEKFSDACDQKCFELMQKIDHATVAQASTALSLTSTTDPVQQ